MKTAEDKRALITELQGHFDGRNRLIKAYMAIKTQTKDASIFYSYIDGWDKKQYINIPIEQEDILPIIERYVKAIDKDIAKIIREDCEQEPKAAMPEHNPAPDDIEVRFENLDKLTGYVEQYKERWPQTYTSVDAIIKAIKDDVIARRKDGSIIEVCDDDGINNAFQIEVCSDWLDKIYIIKATRYEEHEDGKIIISVYLDGQPSKF